eukprot:TRINITY_DN3171_c0_g1_i2.p1 TRINITY_DN3171_c0_g1~~TRINITY_DN3171_c0_g1_i2.p1  ORF type:complete len:299 (-),score=38.11 TRINITY_DN3171_c0_g1_i2:807-1703(-)
MSMNNYLYGQAARLITPQFSSPSQSSQADSNAAYDASNAVQISGSNRNGASNGTTPRLTSAQLDAAFDTIKKQLDNPDDFQFGCSKIVELAPSYLDLRTKGLFCSAAETINSKLGVDGYDISAANEAITAVWQMRRVMTTGFSRAIEKIKANADRALNGEADLKPVKIRRRAKAQPKETTPRSKATHSSTRSHVDFLAQDAYSNGIAPETIKIDNFMEPAEVQPEPDASEVVDKLMEYATVPMSLYPFRQILDPSLLPYLLPVSFSPEAQPTIFNISREISLRYDTENQIRRHSSSDV